MKLIKIIFVCLLLMIVGCSEEVVVEDSVDDDVEVPVEIFEPQTHLIRMDREQFIPYILEINKGDMVIFRNEDDIDYRIVSEGFDSGDIGRDRVYSHTFGKEGTFEYHCKYHPSMKGKIIIN